MTWAVLCLLAGAFLAGVTTWVSELPLRPFYWQKRHEQAAKERETGEKSLTERLAESAKGRHHLDMALTGIKAGELRRSRIIYASVGAVILGGGVFVLFSPLIALIAALVGGGGGWLLPTMQMKSKAAAFRFEIVQALPQFLSLTAMAMTALSLSEAVLYAARASDHRTFQLFDDLIPPPNSANSFGDELFNFGRKFNIPELANRGTALRTTAREGGTNVREIIQRQATDCRKTTNSMIEEEIVGRVTVGSAAPLAIMMGVFGFVLYPVSQSLTGLDVSQISDVTENAQTENPDG